MKLAKPTAFLAGCIALLSGCSAADQELTAQLIGGLAAMPNSGITTEPYRTDRANVVPRPPTRTYTVEDAVAAANRPAGSKIMGGVQ